MVLTVKGIRPMPASRPRFAKGGWAYTPKPYREYLKALGQWFRTNVGSPLLGPLALTLTILVEQPKSTKLFAPKPDVDNYAKGVMDAANKILWEDDSQVVQLAVTKAWAKEDCIDIQLEHA